MDTALYAGLTSDEVRDLTRRGQVNTQPDSSQKTVKDIIKENTLTYFNAIFLILAILVIIAGSFKSLTFLPVIIANTAIGIWQELKAKQVLDELNVLNQAQATAIRDGAEVVVPVQKLVLNDTIVLRAGSQIPADAKVLSGEVSVNESLLTGESDEIPKKAGDSLLSGSFIVSGECVACLTKVGAESYIAKLTQQAKEMPSTEMSEMVKSINIFVIAAGILIIPIGALLLYQSLSQGNSFSESAPSMVAAVIGMIPEGLYLLVSVTLATSAVLLARKQVMLHDMKSIESLARVDVLCVDKTGTITGNDMVVTKVVTVGEKTAAEQTQLKNLLGSYLSNLPDDNQTMQALRASFATTHALQATELMPFSSKYKYSGVRFPDATYVLGAPDILLSSTDPHRESVVNRYAAEGYRMLVFASCSDGLPLDGPAGHMISPLLFILLENPIRQTAAETFSYFQEQGVTVKVISGDNPLTVSVVAAKANIPNADKFVDASTLKNEADLKNAVEEYTVFGRVTPDRKRALVRAMKNAGHTVAMTGDGVNDILAMKDADCSIAMASGSDAAVQAAQVALLDSDFSRMPEIVSQGRRVINNIERSATLFITKNLFSLMLSIFAIIHVLSYPLQPEQISLISAFTIGIPAFFLAMEPNKNRIQGHFMVKVLLKAMPAALTSFFAIAAMVIFGQIFGVSDEDVSVAATFLLAIVGFIILTNISQPVGKYRLGVIIGCVVALFLTGWLFNDLFSIQMISTKCIMLFVLFAIATEPFMRYLTKIFTFLEERLALLEKRRVKHAAK